MRASLIVANQSLASSTLADAVAERLAAGPVRFHIVVPATPVSHGLTWDEGEAVSGRPGAASTRPSSACGTSARPRPGRSAARTRSPRPAMPSAPATFDEVILSTLPPGISRWLGQDVPTRLRNAVTIPVTVVVSPARPAAQRAS